MIILVSVFMGFILGYFGMYYKMKRALDKEGIEVTMHFGKKEDK